jgi:lycopene cyclase domain-containing protein
MTYTMASLLGVLGAVLLDLAVLRTQLLCRKAFWTAYGIVVMFQLVVNGLLTGLHIVRYDESAIIGLRIVYAPVEDLLFGFAMVTLTLTLWVWAGRRARAAAAATHAGSRPRRPRPGGPAPPGPAG